MSGHSADYLPIEGDMDEEEKRFRFLSREIAITAIGMVLSVGIAWGVVSTKVEATEDKVAKVEIDQRGVAEGVSRIRTDIEVIKKEQQHIREKLAERDADIKHIRTLLERRQPNGS